MGFRRPLRRSWNPQTSSCRSPFAPEGALSARIGGPWARMGGIRPGPSWPQNRRNKIPPSHEMVPDHSGTSASWVQWAVHERDMLWPRVGCLTATHVRVLTHASEFTGAGEDLFPSGFPGVNSGKSAKSGKVGEIRRNLRKFRGK